MLPSMKRPIYLPLTDNNSDTYFVRQPSTPDEVERACRALDSCCVAALRYGGSDPNIIRRLGNDPVYCDRLLPGGPTPLPEWIPKPWTSGAAKEPKEEAASAEYSYSDWYDGFPLVEETRADGWCYGAITEFNEPECHPNGCESGDGYVVTPYGLRIGLVWVTGTFAAKWAPPAGECRAAITNNPRQATK